MASFGEELKRERELRAISLREVAEATKVNIRYLEAMERNDFEHLPGGVFNRGFVRAYAQYIGVDPEATVNAYLLQEQAQDRRNKGADQRLMRGARDGGSKLREPERPATKPPPNRSLLRWGLLGLLVAALVIAAVVLWMMISDARATAPQAADRTTVGRTVE